MKKTRKTRKEVPPQDKPKYYAGRKSLITKVLESNPAFKKTLVDNGVKIATNPDQVESQPIETLEDLFLYMQFELERSRNDDLLRGKTLTEYSKEFVNVFKAIEQSKAIKQENEVKLEVAKRNRKEVEEFMKFAIEALATKIADTNLRKELSQEIKNLYDKKYSSDTTPSADTAGDSTTASST